MKYEALFIICGIHFALLSLISVVEELDLYMIDGQLVVITCDFAFLLAKTLGFSSISKP